MPERRPFRFSLQLPRVASHRELAELVHRAEDAGFDLVVAADHLGNCLSPLVAAATVAELSGTLRVGTLVLNNDFHHPALLAQEVATLDLLTEGRVELGLGAGHAKPEYDAAGITFDPAPTRVDRLEESIGVLRALLDGATVDRHGRHYELSDQRCDPLPVQAHVPILVGGGGRRVLGIGARRADAVGFTGLGRTLDDGQRHTPSGFPPSEVDKQVRHVREVAGSCIGAVELQVLVQAVVPTDHALSGAERLVSERLPTLTPEDVLGCPYLLVGTDEAIAELLLAHRARWGFSHYTVRSDALSAFAPVMARLAGR